MKIKYNIYNYENGIRLLTLPDKNINSMILYVYVKVGSKYEPVKLIGLSHLLEHLLFKGSEKYKNHTCQKSANCISAVCKYGIYPFIAALLSSLIVPVLQ